MYICMKFQTAINMRSWLLAGMSYLGIGVQPPQSSLGRMLSEAQTYLFSAPGFALFPGIFLIMLVLGFSLLGEGLKDREKE